MLIIIGCAAIVLWLLCVLVFKITKGLIHLILIVAVIAIIMHVLRPR